MGWWTLGVGQGPEQGSRSSSCTQMRPVPSEPADHHTRAGPGPQPSLQAFVEMKQVPHAQAGATLPPAALLCPCWLGHQRDSLRNGKRGSFLARNWRAFLQARPEPPTLPWESASEETSQLLPSKPALSEECLSYQPSSG